MAELSPLIETATLVQSIPVIWIVSVELVVVDVLKVVSSVKLKAAGVLSQTVVSSDQLSLRCPTVVVN